MSSKSIHKEQFYSTLKTIKKSNNRLIRLEHLELVKNYFSDQHQQNFSCDDDIDDVAAKRIKKRIKRNKFTVVNIRAETNVACTLKKHAEDCEEISSLNISQIQTPNSVTGKFLFSSVSDICQL